MSTHHFSLSICIVLAVMLAGSLAAQPGPPNDCAHPYWNDTLRCRDLLLTGSADSPQPNLTDRPARMADLKEYTRVFLPDRTLRCLDGTRPLLYVAKAVCTNPMGCPGPGGGPYGAPIESDDWLISFQGGGACHAFDSDGDGNVDDGRLCTTFYPGEKREMSSAFDAPMENLGTVAAGTSGGILSRDPGLNPVFAAYNSVRVEKCSYDRYNGRSTHSNVKGELGGTGFNYTLFNHGQQIAEAAIRELMNGVTYTTWGDPNGDGVIDDVQQSLPRLSNARRILFTGHSGAAHGLRHNIDRLAGMVRRGREVDVRVLFDENFLPSIEGEAAHNGLGGDAYADQWNGLSTAAVPAGVVFAYNGQLYHRDSLNAAQLTSWNTALDDSCWATHPPATRWKCRDRQHVLFNHISTPMFIREDFADPNSEHNDAPNGHPIPWALLPGCTYPQVGHPAFLSCQARFDLAQFSDRLTSLATTLLDDIRSRSEIAQFVDTSLGMPGHAASVFLWMPRCGVHDGAYSHKQFFATFINYLGSPTSMHDALVTFLSAPRLDSADWRIDGTVLGRTMTSLCPP